MNRQPHEGSNAPPFALVLGTAQDGGYPQAGCRGACCAPAWADPARRRGASCLAIVDPDSGERWLIDATPDFREQLRLLDGVAPVPASPGLAGIFLTHGHMGHYTGLVHLGREALATRRLPVWAMPRTARFLAANQPWAGLIEWGHVRLERLAADVPVPLSERLTLTPLAVPHRDEHTETVGFRVAGPSGAVLYIPDIDAWPAWDRALEAAIAEVDVAYLDGTFFDGTELPGRDLATIPHPFVLDTLARLAGVPAAARAKVRFIHLNHTNPLLRPGAPQHRVVAAAGCAVAELLERVAL